MTRPSPFLAACALLVGLAGCESPTEPTPPEQVLQMAVMLTPAAVTQHDQFVAEVIVTNPSADTIRLVTRSSCMAQVTVLRAGQPVALDGTSAGCGAAVTTHVFAPGEVKVQSLGARAEFSDLTPAPAGQYVVQATFDSAPGTEFAPAVATLSVQVAPAALLLEDNFNSEHGGTYALNYRGFANWEVAVGSVDLVGTAPYDDFLPTTQGLYVDLDGTQLGGGTLQSKTGFDLKAGTYRLRFRMAGMPRPGQAANTVNVTVGSHLVRTITLESYAPLTEYTETFTLAARSSARVRFVQLGGDNYGNLIDDIRFERL